MSRLPADPFEPDGLAGFARRFRSGGTTSEAVTAAYLARIEALDGRLGAYAHVAGESALKAARAVDGLLASGTDLGPLMGIPVAIKDLIAVEGMPTAAGSDADVSDIIGSEGRFMQRLKRAGAVVLGKAHTTEFALGASPHHRHTPRNPWSNGERLTTSGSSNGSAVAVVAGLTAFAVGSDTGGSVRTPAAMCGTFGLKTTQGLWPVDGVMPLSTTFDTLGLLTASAADAALAFAAIESVDVPDPAGRSLRLALPGKPFFDDLDQPVAKAVEAALDALRRAGAELVPFEIPEADEINQRFTAVSPVEILSVFGPERFAAIRGVLGPGVMSRIEAALDMDAVSYIRLIARARELAAGFLPRLAGFDGVVVPTVPIVAVPEHRFADPAYELEFHRRVGRNVRFVNTLGLSAVSMPVHQFGAALPVGLQIAGHPRGEAALLSVAMAVEKIVGRGPRPDLARG